ncbi:YdcF family protein [Nocardia huaxiensis]|uniref:YdcF family protein n=1 Tax=Nocardia huaxiensis TaxID=2755382 RepID=A0A7D6Z0F3_9NOCA|nr:YdcF family protein [Nocardia huaxiensis]QLY29386.1 YdcF family protein [Nocardia huaxiensis]UFS97134.1 YdcF family protein [Nocardia huaxiensis]
MSPKRPLSVAGVLLAGLGLLVAGPLAAFTAYTMGSARRRPRPGSDVVLVLGCKLRAGAPGRLLTTRLDRAVEVYRAERARGGAPVVVASGGQGHGDSVTEAEAMGRYLEAAGVVGESIVLEPRARNTEENLRFTVRELQARGIDAERARMTVVTSDFHVLRTAALIRLLGLRAEVVGARTARLLTRFAYLREFIAVLVTPVRMSRAGRRLAG